MDQDIEELKAISKQALAIAEDTNHIVRGMRRSQRMGHFFQFVWWALIVGVSIWSYYYYLQPYVGKLADLYLQVQSTSQQTQNLGTQVQSQLQDLPGNFLQNLLKGVSVPSTSAPVVPK